MGRLSDFAKCDLSLWRVSTVFLLESLKKATCEFVKFL